MRISESSYKNKTQSADGGFTLVELMISVTILAIASLGIYQAFGMAGITNAKAQKKQNATSLAESVMEEIKSSSIEELQKRYNGSADKVVSISDSDASYNKDAEVDPGAPFNRVTKAQSAISTGNPGFTNGFLTHSADDWYYVLFKKNAYATTDTEKFNVIATMRAAPYKATTESGDASDANSLKLPVIEEIDPHTKTVLTDKEINKYDGAADVYFSEKTASLGTLKTKKKEIIIEKSGTGEAYAPDPGHPETLNPGRIDVKCTVIYTASDGLTKFKKEVFNGTYISEKNGSDYLPVNNSIYLFYSRSLPLLTDPGDPDYPASEKITVTDTSSNDPHKTFVLFQGANDDLKGTKISISDGSTELIKADKNADVKYDDDEDEEYAATPTERVPGRMFAKNGSVYYWLITNLPASPGVSELDKAAEEVGRISERKEKNRMYIVTVEITKDTPDDNVYATLTSTVKARE